MNSSADYNDAIFAEQAKVVQGQWIKLLISGIDASMIIAWLFWDLVDTNIVVGWTLLFRENATSR